MRAVAILLALVVAISAASASDGTPPAARVGVYYATWAAARGPETGLDDRLVGIPSGVTDIFLAFMKPDATYAGGLELAGTGIEVPYSGVVLKRSVEALRARSPGVRVLVSVGGEQYAEWNRFSPAVVRRFIEDFGLDGVDLDFEPGSPNCRAEAGAIVCDTDGLLHGVVEEARATLPRPLLVWLTATNVGAYGEGEWREAAPTGSDGYGSFLPLLRERRLRTMLDGISIMAYDAGPTYDPIQAYAAYRSRFEGAILVGMTSPPEAWGGHVFSIGKAVETFKAARARGADGAMVFALGKEPPPQPSRETPTSEDLLAALLDAKSQ